MPDSSTRCSLCSDRGVLCTALPGAQQRDGLHTGHRCPLRPPGDRDEGALLDRYRRGWGCPAHSPLSLTPHASHVLVPLGPRVPSWQLWGPVLGSTLLSVPHSCLCP